MKLLVGIDIGGTKCAVSTGCLHEDGSITPQDKIKIPTEGSPEQILNTLCEHTATLCKDATIDAIGISCGGPLDSSRGLVLSPPNLPGWDGIAVTELFEKRFGVPAKLQNDADACALAEWKFGAGRGMQNIVFLTCGTGFGAGLILSGRLYTGACDGAGELGHVRLNEDGPVGYGKRGSFEGYCSGSGIAQMAATMTLEQLQMAADSLALQAEFSGKLLEVADLKVGDPVSVGQKLAKLVDTVLPMIKTDMTDGDITRYLLELAPLLPQLELRTQTIPEKGTYTHQSIRGMSVVVTDFQVCRDILEDTIGG